MAFADKSTSAIRPAEIQSEYGPFTSGVNNRLPDEQLTQTMLRQAINCDLTDVGRLSRRAGYAKLQTLVDAHSLFTDPSGVFCVEGNALLSYDATSDTITQLRTDITGGAPFAFLNVNGDVYYSSAHQNGKIVGGVLKEWGVEVPSGLPTLAQTTGLLPVGEYGVVCTFVNADGEESGAGASVWLNLPAVAGVSVGGIPQPVSAEIVAINIYMTPANGEGVLYLARQVSVGTTTAEIATLTPSVELASQFLSPPPKGNVLAYALGRIYVASGSVVWFTEPLAYGRCRTSRNFLMFPSNVTLMVGVQDGLYVVADKTYFIAAAGTEQEQMRVVLPYGAAYGSLAKIPTVADTWTWRSDLGQVVAGVGGEIKNVQEHQLALPPCESGASLFYMNDGGQQIVATGVPKPEFYAQAQDFIEMEVRRKGA